MSIKKILKKWQLVGSVCLLTALMANAQKTIVPKPTGSMTIVALETKGTYMDADAKIPDDTYLKDINHLLDNFIGTWKGATSTYKYEFRITKFTDYYGTLAEDKLAMRYIITDLNGTVIENTTNITENENPDIIQGHYFAKNKNNHYFLYYAGKEYACGQKGFIIISTRKNVPVNPTEMALNYIPDNILLDFDASCGGNRAKQIMPPKGGVMLTKQ